MLWIYDHYTHFYSYSAGIDFGCQNLTSTDVSLMADISGILVFNGI